MGEWKERRGKRGRGRGGRGEVKGKTFSMFGGGHGILVKKYVRMNVLCYKCAHTQAVSMVAW